MHRKTANFTKIFAVEVILYFGMYKNFYRCLPQFLSILDEIRSKKSAHNPASHTGDADFFRLPEHFNASS